MLKPTDKSALGGERVTGLAIRLGKQCTAFRVLIEARKTIAQLALAPPGQEAAKEQKVQARWELLIEKHRAIDADGHIFERQMEVQKYLKAPYDSLTWAPFSCFPLSTALCAAATCS